MLGKRIVIVTISKFIAFEFQEKKLKKSLTLLSGEGYLVSALPTYLLKGWSHLINFLQVRPFLDSLDCSIDIVNVSPKRFTPHPATHTHPRPPHE